jgi:putative ABC transport system ATP-binding protein
MGRAPPIVEASGLCRRYRLGDKFVDAVQDASLVIEQGEFLAIRGRSGSGKSTLLGLLGLLERPDAGRYRLNGRDILGLSEDRRASIRGCDIGFVFQLPALLPRVPALDNVALPLVYAGVGRAERLRRADAALARVGLGHRREHASHQLSGGEQQRVSIARAIVAGPSLILADEPTGALDSRTSEEIMALFDGLHRGGATLVVVTHAADIASRASRHITLDDGHIVADETVAAKWPARVVAGGRR